MASKDQYTTLFAYHFHTNDRLLDAASNLSDADRGGDPELGERSVHTLLFHILNTDRGWRLGLETGARQPPLNAEDFPDVAALRAGLVAEQAAWNAFLDRATSEYIDGDHQLPGHGGATWTIARWRILQHLILHGMQHHAELALLLTAKDQSPGDLDFAFYQG